MDDLERLAESWEQAASRIDERALLGDPAQSMARSDTLRSCATALRSALASGHPQVPQEQEGGW
jgi:hypothetical protein